MADSNQPVSNQPAPAQPAPRVHRAQAEIVLDDWELRMILTERRLRNAAGGDCFRLEFEVTKEQIRFKHVTRLETNLDAVLAR